MVIVAVGTDDDVFSLAERVQGLAVITRHGVGLDVSAEVDVAV